MSPVARARLEGSADAGELGVGERVVMGVDGVSEKQRPSWVDDHDKPLPTTARRTSENAANAPWLRDASTHETKKHRLFQGSAERREAAAANAFMGEQDPATLESAEVVDIAMRNGFGAAVEQLAHSWAVALTDPAWVAKTVMNTASSFGPPGTSEAKTLALQHIARLIEEGDEAVINDALTVAKPYGWVFFYNSREFYETRNPLDGFGGNGPVVVSHEGAVHLLGSSEAVEDSLAELEASKGWRH